MAFFDGPAKVSRSDDYRYTVEINGADITPLASVEAFVGSSKLRVLNISMGGVALLFDKEPTNSVGDILDIAISIRERAFPVQIEVKGCRGLRLSCSFLNPARVFQGALREFLRPKFLGKTLKKHTTSAEHPEYLSLVSEASKYEAFIGQNQLGVFVWTSTDQSLLRLVAVSQDLIFEWNLESGLRTGRLLQRHGLPSENPPSNPDEGVTWTRHPDVTILHYFADIFLAWLHAETGPQFVESLMLDSEGPREEAQRLRFPQL